MSLSVQIFESILDNIMLLKLFWASRRQRVASLGWSFEIRKEEFLAILLQIQGITVVVILNSSILNPSRKDLMDGLYRVNAFERSPLIFQRHPLTFLHQNQAENHLLVLFWTFVDNGKDHGNWRRPFNDW